MITISVWIFFGKQDLTSWLLDWIYYFSVVLY